MKKDAEKKIKKQPEVSAQIAYQGIRHMLYTKELVPGQRILYRDLRKSSNSAQPLSFRL
jgi:DNA-binding GntR family transcriptional regulator